jgi:hypothetical protein
MVSKKRIHRKAVNIVSACHSNSLSGIRKEIPPIRKDITIKGTIAAIIMVSRRLLYIPINPVDEVIVSSANMKKLRTVPQAIPASPVSILIII